MKAIVVGSIAGGFILRMIVESAIAAEKMVEAYVADGQLAEALDVLDPSTLSQEHRGDPEGQHVIVCGRGIGRGFEVFGPFTDSDVAEEFAEASRGEDGEWEALEVIPA